MMLVVEYRWTALDFAAGIKLEIPRAFVLDFAAGVKLEIPLDFVAKVILQAFVPDFV
jgi:hypothetical protein